MASRSVTQLIPRKVAIDSENRYIYTDAVDRDDVRNATYNFTTVLPDTVKHYKRLRLVKAEIPMTGYNITADDTNTNNVIVLKLTAYTVNGGAPFQQPMPSDPSEVINGVTIYDEFLYSASIPQDTYTIKGVCDALNVAFSSMRLYISNVPAFTISYETSNVFENNNGYNMNNVSIVYGGHDTYSERYVITGKFYTISVQDSNIFQNSTIHNVLHIDESMIPVDYILHGDQFMTTNSLVSPVKNGRNDVVILHTEFPSGTNIFYRVILAYLPEGMYNEETLAEAVSKTVIETYDAERALDPYLLPELYSFDIVYDTTTMKYMYTKDMDIDRTFGFILSGIYNNDDEITIIISNGDQYSVKHLTPYSLMGVDTITPPVPYSFPLETNNVVYISDTVAQLSTDEYLYIGVNSVRGQSTELTANTPILWDKGIIARIQLTQGPSEVQFYYSDGGNTFDVFNQLAGEDNDEYIQDDLVITLYRANGSLYNLNGADWSLEMEFYV